MLLSNESIGEKSKQHRWVCFPAITAGIDITSQPESARTAATISETARNVKAPVAAGPPYPRINTARNGPNDKSAPITEFTWIINFKIII